MPAASKSSAEEPWIRYEAGTPRGQLDQDGRRVGGLSDGHKRGRGRLHRHRPVRRHASRAGMDDHPSAPRQSASRCTSEVHRPAPEALFGRGHVHHVGRVEEEGRCPRPGPRPAELLGAGRGDVRRGPRPGVRPPDLRGPRPTGRAEAMAPSSPPWAETWAPMRTRVRRSAPSPPTDVDRDVLAPVNTGCPEVGPGRFTVVPKLPGMELVDREAQVLELRPWPPPPPSPPLPACRSSEGPSRRPRGGTGDPAGTSAPTGGATRMTLPEGTVTGASHRAVASTRPSPFSVPKAFRLESARRIGARSRAWGPAHREVDRRSPVSSLVPAPGLAL